MRLIVPRLFVTSKQKMSGWAAVIYHSVHHGPDAASKLRCIGSPGMMSGFGGENRESRPILPCLVRKIRLTTHHGKLDRDYESPKTGAGAPNHRVGPQE
jgi:hypothetical protein